MWNFFSKLIPVTAHACATCGFADPSTPYYLKMIFFMTSLPVLFVTGVVLFLRRKRRTHAADE
jgi:hypothetical protein